MSFEFTRDGQTFRVHTEVGDNLLTRIVFQEQDRPAVNMEASDEQEDQE